MKYDTNLIVIGAGSGGLVTSYIAAAIKAKVVLIEKSEMGGDCLNTGCVPSKSLIASAKFVHNARHAENFGMQSAEVNFDFADIMERIQSIIASIAPHDSVERYSNLGVEVIKGDATITSPHTVEINGRTISASSIVIAAGAEPFIPPIPGIEHCNYYTSDTIWQLRTLPKKFAVLGGGPIGCELAQAFARLGSDVCLIQRSPAIMVREDEEFSGFMVERFKSEGIRVLTGHSAQEIISKDDRCFIRCDGENESVDIEFDTLLVALGRAARLDGYGLDSLNIPISKRKTIETNEYLQAGYSHIYAVGDVTGPYQFTHAAAHQAWYACVNALFRPFKRFRVDYSTLPWCTYTDPEVARVGLNEKDARRDGIAYDMTRYSLAELDRAKTDGYPEGEIKVLTVPGKDKILGVTILGHNAGELIAEFVLAMRHGLGLNKILGTIHAYPTWMEANKYAAGNWKKAHVPQWALNLLEKFHRFRR